MASHHKRQNPSDNLLSHFLQQSSSSHLYSTHPRIAAWVRELSNASESVDPAAPPTPPAKRRRVLRELHNNPQSRRPQCAKLKHPDTHAMSGSSKKQKEQKTAAIEDDDSRATRNRTRRGGRSENKAVLPLREQMISIPEDNANTLPSTEGFASTSAASEYEAISQVPSFPLPIMTSSKGRSPTRSSSPKKRNVVKREDLALLSPTIEFRDFEEAENLGIELPKSIKELWFRCEVSSL